MKQLNKTIVIKKFKLLISKNSEYIQIKICLETKHKTLKNMCLIHCLPLLTSQALGIAQNLKGN